MIKAPYNFVPLNEKVFFPGWADEVSHDVPFKDGESGCITIKITAKSPVYVRNGGAWSKDNQINNNNNPNYQDFSNFNNRYFIPGTSIKGMIRNVLEIISFGKIVPHTVDSLFKNAQQTVHSLIPDSHKSIDEDLAELIFGNIHDKSLKGRIQFSHAFENSGVVNDDRKIRILGSPKGSYENTYLQQGSYQNSFPVSKIKGWKRYPIHQKKTNVEGPQVSSSQISTTFIPLKEGADFICKIRFHNLRKTEIGALLSALTFHGNEGVFFHSLGMAKPLGCGKVAINITNIDSTHLTFSSQDDYLNCFVQKMEDTLSTTEEPFVWRIQPQINELLTMSHEQRNQNNSVAELCYMTLNEYVVAKKGGHKLTDYSRLSHGVQPVSLDTVDSFKECAEEIIEAVEDGDIAAVMNMLHDELFFDSLAMVLGKYEFNESWNQLYALVPNYPIIILKQASNLNDRKLKNRIIALYEPNKEDKYVQDIFDIVINRRLIDLENIPNWAQPLAYGWEDLGKNEGDLCDFIEELKEKPRVWPPKSSLPDFVGLFKFADPENKVYCELALEEFNDT